MSAPEPVPTLTEEIAILRAWKGSAMSSLSDWHELTKEVPGWFTTDKLGWPWPRVIAAYIAHLQSRAVQP